MDSKHKTNKYNMFVEQAYKVLTDKSMSKLKCNFKIYKPSPGNPGGGRKPGSKNKMTLAKLAVTVNELGIRLDQLAKIVQDGFARQEQFNNFVLDQFKKHGWTN